MMWSVTATTNRSASTGQMESGIEGKGLKKEPREVN
jgi:hypothetical protein